MHTYIYIHTDVNAYDIHTCKNTYMHTYIASSILAHILKQKR